METVRVNMTPNNEIKTIHCSQNDGKTRKWGFELYKEDGIIDSSSIESQMIYDCYKGGTEQILPENSSVPTTSSIIADIQYPDALRSEQEFLYRESPATEDGQARITRIKGNTIKFNQLVKSTDTSIALQSGHKFYTVISGTKTIVSGTGQTISVTGGTDMVFDLTSMGIDNLTTTSEVEAWLSSHIGNLPYYDYTLGTLIPFKGTGIKTVGKNHYDLSKVLSGTQALSLTITDTGFRAVYPGGSRYVDINNFRPNSSPYINEAFQAGTKLKFSFDYVGLATTWTVGLRNRFNQFQTGSVGISSSGHLSMTITVPDYDCYLSLCRTGNSTDAFDIEFSNVQLEVGETETAFVPYQESTLSLPISDFFPTGMKSAGSVYDELTENKATTRIGSRAYQSGDESDTSVITDGTTTYYPLATPTETDITTASLVTEKGETPLFYDNDILKADCLTALSSESGIFDAKIKLMDDETVYSQKIQLHVERKP